MKTDPTRPAVDATRKRCRLRHEFDRTHGEPRITTELTRRARTVNHKRVERLMRVNGIVGVHKPARVHTCGIS